MKRDPELIRKLLIFFEDKKDDTLVDAKSVNIDNHDEDTIRYHMVLMCEAGFLSCEPTNSSTSDRLIDALPFRLTWKGHEFLDAARNDTTWSKAKEMLKSKSLTVSFEVLQKLLTHLATEGLRETLGVAKLP